MALVASRAEGADKFLQWQIITNLDRQSRTQKMARWLKILEPRQHRSDEDVCVVCGTTVECLDSFPDVIRMWG